MVDESCRVENFHNGSELASELQNRGGRHHPFGSAPPRLPNEVLSIIEKSCPGPEVGFWDIMNRPPQERFWTQYSGMIHQTSFG